MIAGMAKRSSRIARRNELKAVEAAIGISLGKNPRTPAPGNGRDPRVEKPLRRAKKKN